VTVDALRRLQIDERTLAGMFHPIAAMRRGGRRRGLSPHLWGRRQPGSLGGRLIDAAG
jgi:hypothetical protein